MWTSSNFHDFELLDMGDGAKLERWGKHILARPEPQAIWEKQHPEQWKKADAVYHRSETGGGAWEQIRPLPERWNVRFEGLTFIVRPTGFKHTGLFPEQAANWEEIMRRVQSRTEHGQEVRVLNLFAYTGGATMAAAKAGAQVTHVDAARGMVAWAKENAQACGLANAPIRYLVDDCMKFVQREIRRGKRYHGIVMDPPSYGRGPGGEMFRFETHVFPLVCACAQLLEEDALFFILNSYTSGFAPQIAHNTLLCALPPGTVESDNIGIASADGLLLPCGATARWQP